MAKRGRRALRCAGALLVLACLVPASAVAQTGGDPAETDARTEEVRWHEDWETFRAWQWVATPTLLAGSLALRYLGPQPGGRWEGGIGFDGAVTDALEVRRDPGRANLALATDLHLYGSLALLMADAVITAGLVHGRWDVALQMALIDLQSVALVMAVLWSGQLVASRARPYERFCDDSPPEAFRGDCIDTAGERGRSFIAGHTAIVLTAAGLTCTHHGRMPLFGGGVAEDLTCGALIVASALNGVARIATDNHYTTDVILGLGLGAAAGWLVPAALHYGFGDDDATGATVVPLPLLHGGGVAVIGALR